MKFKIGDKVVIKKYINDDHNKYWVSNMNVPFMGTISSFFMKKKVGKK